MVVPCSPIPLLPLSRPLFPFFLVRFFKKLNCQQGFRPHHTKIVIPQELFQRRAVFCSIVEFFEGVPLNQVPYGYWQVKPQNAEII